VYDRVRLFHTDAVLCGVSALTLRTNAPTILRDEALTQYSLVGRKQEANRERRIIYRSKVLGSNEWVHAEKAMVANCAAVREWDSNGTVFGYHPTIPGHTAGEFGHNDYYAVVLAGCHNHPSYHGTGALQAMILLDEIRGRLAEVFSLKTYKIDHVVYGAIASAATYGAMVGASPLQIEHAIGMVVAHYIPWRAIRAGKQLSDSKGASAALSTEVAIQSVHRAMQGFIGPKDIFRNPEALFRQFEPTNDDNESSPFDIVLTNQGDDFAVMGMHFKLGLYEHQSAGAIQGIISMLTENPEALLGQQQHSSSSSPDQVIDKIKITAYEPAFGIIGDPAKRNPTTRQSADHSMVYIIATVLRKAFEKQQEILADDKEDQVWKTLMLSPLDYSTSALTHPQTRRLMEKITFQHGGADYDAKYPEGIPTSIEIHPNQGKPLNSGLVMFPGGHARNTTVSLKNVLQHKFQLLGGLAFGEDQQELTRFLDKLNSMGDMSNAELENLYGCNIHFSEEPLDETPREQ
jgi:2-methylcitrate dehydratase